MKTLLKVCLSLALGTLLVQYGFSQAAASSSKEVTIPPSTEEVPEQHLYANDSVEEEYFVSFGLRLPQSVMSRLGAGNVYGAWEEFEEFKKTVDKKQWPQVLEAEIMLCNNSANMDAENRDKWIEKRNETQKTLLAEFPKWSGSYTSQINPEATPAQIIEFTTKALQLEPNDYLSLQRRGRAYLQIGRTTEACADFERCPDKSKIWEYESICKKRK